jgi:O-antigen ligase
LAAPRTTSLELPSALHAGAVVIAASWALGGNAGWARTALSVFGSFGLFITIGAIVSRLRGADGSFRALHFLWPLFGYDVLVLLSALQPAFTPGVIYGADVLVPITPLTAWPCSAQPGETLRQLWLFNALVLPAFNLLFCVRTRRVLRVLLLGVAANALALAVFGTLQKLSGAGGLFFGAIASPNKTFFASFIYHNHWGAFVILMLATTLGLLFHQASRNNARDFSHSPAFLGLVGALILAATAPLSTSRSTTALAGFLLSVAFVDALRRLLRRRSTTGRSRAVPALALLLTAATALVAIVVLARPFIASRASDTREQLAVMRAQGSIGSRATLYADTWRMAADRPAFGWGLASYPAVFPRYNTQQSRDNLPVIYVDAHSDWLQSLAETGFAGTALLGLLVTFPVFKALRLRAGPLPAYLLGGCGLVLLYAWIEFPFGCPAVVAAFWLLLFSAARLAQLDAHDRPKRLTLSSA